MNEKERVIEIPEIERKFDTRGLGWNFFNVMKKYKNRNAQVNAATGESQTYETLLKKCVRVAIHMRSSGVEKGDVISIISYGHLEQQVVFIAGTFLGAVIAPLDPHLSDIKDFEEMKPKIAFVDEAGAEFLKKSRLKPIVVAFYANYEEFAAEQEGEKEFEPATIEDEMDMAAILFTSGTTGAPKGVCLNHYSVLRKGYNFSQVQEIVLHFTPLYWISAVNILVSAITGGACKIVSKGFDPKEAFRLIESHKIEVMFTSTVQAIMMCKTGRPDGVDASPLKKFIFGGSGVSEHIYEELRKVFPEAEIYHGYGQSETCGTVLFFDGKKKDIGSSPDKPLTCGRPIPGISYKVVDPETGRALGPNETGELRLKSQLNFSSYFNNPVTTAEAFDPEGWLKTGDLVYYDEDLYFYWVDRIKELFKYKGWSIAPAVVEGVLQTHPAVERCVIVPVPHEDDINHALGVVMLKKDSGGASEEELLRYVGDNVAEKYLLTAGVKIVGSIPMLLTGKIDRRRVKGEVLSKYP